MMIGAMPSCSRQRTAHTHAVVLETEEDVVVCLTRFARAKWLEAARQQRSTRNFGNLASRRPQVPCGNAWLRMMHVVVQRRFDDGRTKDQRERLEHPGR